MKENDVSWDGHSLHGLQYLTFAKGSQDTGGDEEKNSKKRK